MTSPPFDTPENPFQLILDRPELWTKVIVRKISGSWIPWRVLVPIVIRNDGPVWTVHRFWSFSLALKCATEVGNPMPIDFRWFTDD